jgi:hypothetical protein
MAYNIQVVVDCADPHRQADWWAETLGWDLEPTDQELIDRMIAGGHASGADTIVHNGVRVWKTGAAISPRDEAGSPGHRRILFQHVPEPKTVKDRIHLDIRLDGDEKDAIRSRLEERGAVFLHEGREGPFTWYTMADPEGNEFCLA